jgi:hypothetical protein
MAGGCLFFHSMTLKQILKEKNDRLESVPEALLTVVERTQKKLFAKLVSFVDQLERDGAQLISSSDNFFKITAIIDQFKDAIFQSEYVDAVKSFAKEFDAQKKVNDKYFQKGFGDFDKVDIAQSLVKKAKADAVNALLSSPLDDNFLKPLENLLIDSVATGAGWRETLDAIQKFTTGDEDKDGKLLQYSKQIAHDDFAFSDRAYSNAVADELDVEWYFYSGGEIPTSRCFCIERHEQYFHHKEIEAWGRGENLGECKSGDLWAGAVSETNAQTIFIYAGGFNCGHSIMPVSVFDVPKEVIQRNIDNGNYDPTEAESEMLGV